MWVGVWVWVGGGGSCGASGEQGVSWVHSSGRHGATERHTAWGPGGRTCLEDGGHRLGSPRGDVVVQVLHARGRRARGLPGPAAPAAAPAAVPPRIPRGGKVQVQQDGGPQAGHPAPHVRPSPHQAKQQPAAAAAAARAGGAGGPSAQAQA